MQESDVFQDATDVLLVEPRAGDELTRPNTQVCHFGQSVQQRGPLSTRCGTIDLAPAEVREALEKAA